MVGGFTKKVFPIDCVITYFSQSIANYLFPIFFSIDLKEWDYPHIAYIVINFKQFVWKIGK